MCAGIRSEYIKNGFHLERSLIPREEIIVLREKMVDVFRNFTKDKTTEFNKLIVNLFSIDRDGFIGCANACQGLVDLHRLAVDVRLTSVLNKLGLANLAVNTRPLVSFSSRHTSKNENYWRIPAHQDWPSTQGSINGVTCWMPLVDVQRDLGPLELVSGSHFGGLLDHEDDGVPKIKTGSFSFVPVPMECGDALFFSNFTVHRSGDNVSEDIRWTVHFRYDDLEEKTFIDRKYPRHRIDQRKEGILWFPTKEQIDAAFTS